MEPETPDNLPKYKINLPKEMVYENSSQKSEVDEIKIEVSEALETEKSISATVKNSLKSENTAITTCSVIESTEQPVKPAAIMSTCPSKTKKKIMKRKRKATKEVMNFLSKSKKLSIDTNLEGHEGDNESSSDSDYESSHNVTYSGNFRSHGLLTTSAHFNQKIFKSLSKVKSKSWHKVEVVVGRGLSVGNYIREDDSRLVSALRCPTPTELPPSPPIRLGKFVLFFR